MFLAACGVALAASGAATVEGTVQLPKPAPAPAERVHYQSKTTEHPGVPDPPAAVVYLEGPFSSDTATNASARAQMEQRHYQFAPGLLAVQKGTAVEFPNGDDAYHNVFSYSKTKRFDLGRYRKDEKPPALVFDKPGVVKLYCEIHEHMRGTILVLDTPYFVKSDAAGKFRLDNLPAGKYTLKAWVSETTTWDRPVELTDGGTLKVDFSGP